MDIAFNRSLALRDRSNLHKLDSIVGFSSKKEFGNKDSDCSAKDTLPEQVSSNN